MGISGLLPFVKDASKNVHINELRGRTVAIDSYCWLHRGVIGCAEKVIKGEDTDIYVQYCFKYIDMLLTYKITPIMVFDGQNLAAKAGTEDKRRENRAQAKKRAVECMKLNKMSEARKNFIQAVDINPRMALKLIQACRARKIDCVVAPYEADAQLAFLNLNGYVDFVISEDSDLLVFGCSKVLFKLDTQGNGLLVERDKLFVTMKEKQDTFKMDHFRHMCILSGCDYIDSLPGIGLKKALKFIKTVLSQNICDALPKIPRILNMKNLVVTKEYINNFMIADATFRHQLVFDPMKRSLTYLTDPDKYGTNPEYLCNAGEIIDNNIAFQLAIGNRSPQNLEVLDNWNPDNDKSLHTFRISIWSKNYQKPKKTDLKVPINKETTFSSTQGKNMPLTTSKILTNKVTENLTSVTTFSNTLTNEEFKVEEKIKNEMEKMYFSSDDEPSSKRICLNSSQKENNEEVSPILNRISSNVTVNKFAKKHFGYDDDSDDDFQTDKKKEGGGRPNLKRIRKIKTVLKENDIEKEHSDVDKKSHDVSKISHDIDKGIHGVNKITCNVNEESRDVNKETRDRNTHNEHKETCDINKETRGINKETQGVNKETQDINKETHDVKKESRNLKKESRNVEKEFRLDKSNVKEYKKETDKNKETKNDIKTMEETEIQEIDSDEIDDDFKVMKGTERNNKITVGRTMKNNIEDDNKLIIRNGHIPKQISDKVNKVEEDVVGFEIKEILSSSMDSNRVEDDIESVLSPSVKESQESLTNGISNCIIDSESSGSLQAFKFTNSQIEWKKETVQVKNTQIVSKIIPKGMCRRPGLSRKNSKTVIPSNQTTLSHFFKSS